MVPPELPELAMTWNWLENPKWQGVAAIVAVIMLLGALLKYLLKKRSKAGSVAPDRAEEPETQIEVHDGEIRKRDLVPALEADEEQGGHARRVMKSYETSLAGGKDTALSASGSTGASGAVSRDRGLSFAELRAQLGDPSTMSDAQRERLLELLGRVGRVQALGNEYALVVLSASATAAVLKDAT